MIWRFSSAIFLTAFWWWKYFLSLLRSFLSKSEVIAWRKSGFCWYFLIKSSIFALTWSTFPHVSSVCASSFTSWYCSFSSLRFCKISVPLYFTCSSAALIWAFVSRRELNWVWNVASSILPSINPLDKRFNSGIDTSSAFWSIVFRPFWSSLECLDAAFSTWSPKASWEAFFIKSLINFFLFLPLWRK